MRKHLVTAVVVMALFSAPAAFAQDPEGAPSKGFCITSVSAGSGDSAISSGLVGIVRFGNVNDRTVEVAVQQDQAWVIFGPKFKLGNRVKGYVGASAGHMQGSPWIGPYFDAEVELGRLAGQKVSISTMHWPCLFPFYEPSGWKNDGKPANQEKVFLGYLMSYQVSFGPLGLTYARLNFLDDPWNDLPGVVFTQKVMDGVKVTGSATYNNNARKWMYFIGASWSR